MQKMMYFCPVDWNWIKQRPQFLAEELDNFFDIHVMYPFKNKRNALLRNTKNNIRTTPYFSLPTLNGKLSFLKRLNTYLVKLQLKIAVMRFKPDIVWFTLPWQYACFPQKTTCKIIYDCMDDHAAISMDQRTIDDLCNFEKKLISRADSVFVSSQNLISVLKKRYLVASDKFHLLRNGYNANWEKNAKNTLPKNSVSPIKIGYFGTVGRWFDFELLLNSLEKKDQLEYHIFGPLEAGIRIPVHDKIIYRGVLEHSHIQENATDMDALIMPFVVNDIVKSVDPVKLYEYIWLEKPIVCTYYPEIKRFDPFVLFYNTQEEYLQKLEMIVRREPTKYSHEQANDFLSENNWKARAIQAVNHINSKETQGGQCT